jgi:hypothetical protein
MGYNWHQRAFVVGETGSGKSEVLNLMFSQLRNQRLLLDTKPEFLIPDVPVVHQVDDIDWDQPIIHYRPSTGTLEEIDELFYDCYHRRNLTICCHELGDLCEDQPGRATTYTRKYIRGGNIFGNGLLAGSQRLVCIPRQARTESQHVIHMVPGLDPDDHKIAASMMRVNTLELDRLLAEAQQLAPKHSAIWFEKQTRELRLVPPLPEHLRRQIIVRRAVNLDNRDTVNRDGDHEDTGPEAQPHYSPGRARRRARTF